MGSLRRVFVTGMGAVTATGATLDATWQAVLAGQQGLDEIKLWDLSTWSHRLGGELQSYQPATMLPDRKLLKVISRQDVIGIAAAMQAIAHSELPTYQAQLDEPSQAVFAQESAIYVGSPGNKYFQQYDFLPLLAKTQGDMPLFAEQLFAEVHPTWLLRILPNNVLAYLGITYGFKGANHNITNHAVSGMQALLEAYQAILTGQASRAIVVGYDIGTDPQALYYYAQLGLLSARDLRPFDKAHDGTILAEGAAALILESEEAVLARNARCYSEVLGGHSSSEAQGLFAIDPKALALQALITHSLARAQISPAQVGMITAHGNGSYQSDVTEALAIAGVFTDLAVPVTAFKWSMGHTLCASGVLDAALAICSMKEHCVPGVANLQSVAEECATLNLSQTTRPWDASKPYTLVINRGFGGMNACVVLRACA